MPEIIVKDNIECYKLEDLLIEETGRFSGFVYCNVPFMCGLEEALAHLKDACIPVKNIEKIERTDKRTTFFIRPAVKRKRKLLEITLFVW